MAGRRQTGRVSNAVARRKPINHPKPLVTTVRELFGSAMRCGFEGCREPLYRDSEQTHTRLLNVEVAHIHARSEGGPRWDGGMSREENRSSGNLILMCRPHAREIDDAPGRFSADLLREWKRAQVREADAAAATVLTDEEAEEAIAASFGTEEVVEALSQLLPFTVRSRSRGEALAIAAREGRARRRVRLAAVPESRKDAVLEWMEQHPPPAVVVPEGAVRVLIAAMGAGKSEYASRWWHEGLEVAADDEDWEIPIWLEARTLGGSLAAAVTDALGRDPARPCRVVVDDLTLLPVAEANRLLDEARRLVGVWPRMRILATCRPGPKVSDDELLNVGPWPVGHGAALVRLIIDDVPSRVWTREVDDLLTSPLLTLALAARLAVGRSAQVSPVQLLADMAITILDRERPEAAAQSAGLLARLAARAITTQAAVPPTALGLSRAQAWPILDSGLVVDEPAGLRFSLPVFEQHFGAEALRAGLTSLEEAASAAAFPLWRYPIAHIAASSDPDEADALMLQLARVNPGAASWILDETTRTPGPLPPGIGGRPWNTCPASRGEAEEALRVGRWLREPVEALLDGFGACGRDLARHHDGRLVQWGVRIFEDPTRGRTGTILAEARDEVTPDLVTHTIEPYENALSAGWSRSTGFELPIEPLGRWRWARDRLQQPLAALLRQRRLPVPQDSPLATEREWFLAQHIIRRHSGRRPGAIPLADLTDAIEEMMETVNRSVRARWTIGSAQLDSADIRWIRPRLTRHHGEVLPPPRPAPDRTPAGNSCWRWRAYSPELTCSILTEVFRDALIGYHDLVTTNLTQFGDALGMFSALPLRVIGNVIMDIDDPGDNDGMWYTLTPDPDTRRGAPPRVDFTLAAAPQPFHLDDTRAFRNRRYAFHQPFSRLTILPTGQDRAATNLAYRWLASDLKSLGWWSGTVPAFD